MWDVHVRLTCVVLLCWVCVFDVRTSEGQLNNITPPPKDGDRPVVADGIVYYLRTVPKHCLRPRVTKYPSGGIITDRRALMKSDNPHVIYGNIEIAPSGCVYIEPGAVLKFGPGFGMIVNGTLISRGSEEPGGRIVMTKDVGGDPGSPTGDWKNDARLVDGNTTQDGQLNLFYQGRWRGICTNYINFTKNDVSVTCQHLGFLKGNFTYHSFARNYTDYMLFEAPKCTGQEGSLLQCPGVASIKIGDHICDGQQLIGFECEGLRPGLAIDHWRGLEFYNSSSRKEQNLEANMYVNESYSWIEYTDILYAGFDTFRGKGVGINYQRASVSASPMVPLMNNVTIKYGAYDGVNLTNIEGGIHIANCTITHNRGYGIFIQTAVGRVLVNMTDVLNNWGDGIKMYMVNLTYYDFRKHFPPETQFCNQPNLGNQVFPVYKQQDIISPEGGKVFGNNCDRTFKTTLGKTVTVHFIELIRDPDASATIEIRDGGASGNSLGIFNVNNGSFPQSVTTKTQTAYIKLQFNIPRNRICKSFQPCIRMLIELGTSRDPEDDFRLIYSKVNNNTGYGVSIQNMRSKSFFNTSEVSFNQYGAGIRIYQGAGEVTVNNTYLEGNQASGINITYSGGFQLLNNTRLIGNKGYGVITEYLLLNRSRIEAEQRLEVVRGEYRFNEWRALRIGNYCRGGHFLVNESYFSYNLDESIEYLSCNISVTTNNNFSVAFTTFHANARHGIFVRPMVNTVGIITNNTFSNHSLGALLIDNGYDLILSRWYRNFPVEYNIFENTFTDNNGRYAANVRLTQDSPFQKMYFKFNKLINNDIQDSFMYLNPRNRANAVVVVSSGNILLQRNLIHNPDSVREVATHLIDPSVTIDGKENWWNREVTRSEQLKPIHNGIFDQDDRYNLAKINYAPVLNSERLYDNYFSNVASYNRPFQRGNAIGGVLELGDFNAQPNFVYHVDRDIYIIPSKRLILKRGVTLEFESSVGMVVHGCLQADGVDVSGTIKFQLRENPDIVPVENRTASVRLVDGQDEFEGRLEVEIDGVWGTVCNEGWNDQNSVLVCQQLGLTYNPEFGRSQQQLMASSGTDILLNWVSCEEYDTDLTKCRASHVGDFTCEHNTDVYLRCQSPTWSGVTIPATPRNGQYCNSQLRHIALLKAGLLDHATMAYTPALRIDYNFYQISHLTVNDSLSDGVHIKFNNPYSENRIEYGTFVNNAGNGLVLRNPQMELLYSTVTANGKAGFLYDPFFTEYEALEVRNSIHATHRVILTEQATVHVGDRSMMFLVTKSGQAKEDKTYYCELSVSTTFRVTLQILDYSPMVNIEEVIIFDSGRQGIQGTTKRWKIEDDLIDFPIVSSGQYLTIQFHVRGVRSGRLSFAAISQTYSPAPPVMKMSMLNCTFDRNYQGIVTKHYNSPSNNRMELYHRHKLETFKFERINVYHSLQEAMHVPSVTKFNDEYVPTWEELTKPQRVATIEYIIQQCNFLDNAYGILGEHNHVDFANNVWHWLITRTKIKESDEGGFEIEVPRVNDEEDNRKQHSIIFEESEISNNKKFAFTIAGFHSNLSIINNNFINNYCRKGLMTISGMEKDLLLENNEFRSNIGRYVIDLDIISHAEYSQPVVGLLRYNDLRDNRYFPGQTPPGADYSPKTYAVAFRGLQDVSAHRNLFQNPDLGYELVAATTALLLGNTLNVKENWWGKTDIYSIRKRIFDFDDWNNYAIASYHPYLTSNNVNADLSVGDPVDIPLDPSNLGGRVTKSLILPSKPTPYVVLADLTVMPGAVLTLEPGTELHFRPNVGILVLGQLVARGLLFSRIKLKALAPASAPTSRSGRSTRSTSVNIRLRGDTSLFEDAGFLELYNASTKSWNIMCDNQFNEKTAEVVCRELGKETINVRVRFTHLYDHYIHGGPSYFRKEFWTYNYYCRGDELSLSQCQKRYNYNLMPCVYAANYTFITCGKRNIDQGADYWGNIRFATEQYQERFQVDKNNDLESVMEYVDIEGAGMLHGEKVGAIQTTYVTPVFKDINITNCASNGYDIIAPRDILEIKNQNVSNNLGYGINFLILNGESSNRPSSFQPLGHSTIPYHVFGLVEICRMEKEITLDNRLILHYKYSHKAVDCVKIIRSSNPSKQVGIRFLQLNLFQEDFSRNVIEIFNGKEISKNTLLKAVVANSSGSDIVQQYSTTGDTLTVHMHASVSQGTFGFIAEVMTLPPAGLTYPDSNYRHRLDYTVVLGNQDGAIQYKNVGEINPSLFINWCWLDSNGVAILNLTSPPTIDISLQGTLLFDFSHNFVGRNKGGTYIAANTKTIATALRGNITNNIFAYGSNGEALNISGHYYERIYMFQNYFYAYHAGDYRDIIHISEVVVNFTYNIITKNTGHYILAAYNSKDPQAQQVYTRSGFRDNNSTALYESTVKVGTGRPVFKHNYFVNEENDFELEADTKVPLVTSKIDAIENWWGSNHRAYINGKIWDESDNDLLSAVEFWPPKLDNRSVIEGKCLPGWKLDSDRCYRYMGGALPYTEAHAFCRQIGGFLAEARDREYFLVYLLKLMRNIDEPTVRVWVMGDVQSGQCSAFEKDYIVVEEDCGRLLHPFVCEKDPYIAPPSESTILALAIGIGAGVGGAVIVIVVVIIILWCMKSRQRQKSRFERTASMRSSVRSTMRSKSQMTVLSEAPSKRRIPELDDQFSQISTVTKTSHGGDVVNGSVESIHSNYRYYTPTSTMDRKLVLHEQHEPEHQNRAYDDNEDDDDDGFDDTFDDDDDDLEPEDIKVKIDDSRGPIYGNTNFPPAQGRLPKVQKFRRIGSREMPDNDDYADDDERSIELSKSKSLSSFSAPESPTTPIKENIFLPQSRDLPTPPPDPRIIRYANPPPPSQPVTYSRYANVPGYHETPKPRSNTPDFRESPRSNTPQFHDSPKTSPRTLPRTYHPVRPARDDQPSPIHPGVERFRESPAPSQQSRSSPDITQQSRASPVPVQRLNRPSPTPKVQSSSNPYLSTSPRQPPNYSTTPKQPPNYSTAPRLPANYRYVPRQNVLYLENGGNKKTPNQDSIETEI